MPTDVQRDEVRRLLAAGAQLVDVLPAEEYAAEHIAGAVASVLSAHPQRQQNAPHQNRAGDIGQRNRRQHTLHGTHASCAIATIVIQQWRTFRCLLHRTHKLRRSNCSARYGLNCTMTTRAAQRTF